LFDAQVRTGVLGLWLGREPTPVRRFVGPEFTTVPGVTPVHGAATWSWLIADVSGVPSVTLAPRRGEDGGVLGDLAVCTADFRDQYYGLVGAVGDGVDGPPLVTSGLIDPGRCRWGDRPTRFAKQRYAAPRVDLGALAPALRAWATARLVPKVLVASQTKVIEAVADEAGAWLPSVPVVSVVPRRAEDVWPVAAVLTSPVAAAWLAGRRFGSGLSATALRVTASDLAEIPVPGPAGCRSWAEATRLLRAGDVTGCGAAMLEAHGLAARSDVLIWWKDRLPA
jgi:hypothetical protein